MIIYFAVLLLILKPSPSSTTTSDKKDDVSVSSLNLPKALNATLKVQEKNPSLSSAMKPSLTTDDQTNANGKGGVFPSSFGPSVVTKFQKVKEKIQSSASVIKANKTTDLNPSTPTAPPIVKTKKKSLLPAKLVPSAKVNQTKTHVKVNIANDPAVLLKNKEKTHPTQTTSPTKPTHTKDDQTTTQENRTPKPLSPPTPTVILNITKLLLNSRQKSQNPAKPNRSSLAKVNQTINHENSVSVETQAGPTPASDATETTTKPKAKVQKTLSASKKVPASPEKRNIPAAPSDHLNITKQRLKEKSSASPTKHTITVKANHTTSQKNKVTAPTPPRSKGKEPERSAPTNNNQTAVEETGLPNPVNKLNVTRLAYKPEGKNQTVAPPTKVTPGSEPLSPKAKPSSAVKVVLSGGFMQKDPQRNSSRAVETELSLKPGSPLVMTHHINLLPGDCVGHCEAEMAELKKRVEALEKEMTTMKKKCTFCPSPHCPSNCSEHGTCEDGVCACSAGFGGSDCSVPICPSNCSEKGKCVKGKCVCHHGYTGSDCNREMKKPRVSVETVTVEAAPEDDSLPETTSVQKAKLDKVVFTKKEDEKAQKKEVMGNRGTEEEGKEANTKVVLKDNSASNGTKSKKTGGQASQPRDGGRRLEQVSQGKIAVKKMDPKPRTTGNKEELRDQPVQNSTRTSGANVNGTLSAVVQPVKTTKPLVRGGENVNMTKVGKVRTSSLNRTHVVKDKKPVHDTATVVLKEGQMLRTKDENLLNTTGVTRRHVVKQSSIDVVLIQNRTSTSFVLTWQVQGTFWNFTVSWRELRLGEEREVQEVKEEAQREITDGHVNVVEAYRQKSNKTSALVHSGNSSKPGKNMRRFHQVLSGAARSLQLRSLRPQTHYAVSLYGTSPGYRSKLHHLTVTTAPEAPSELVFSNVSETSVTVSWSKPKNRVSGFRVSYMHTESGESNSMSVDGHSSAVVLTRLSAGSSYNVSVASKLENDPIESNPNSAVVVTVPDSPTHLQAINVTDTRALLVWKPAQAKVDRYVLSYSSAKVPNVTVTVMLSGRTVEHQLRGLHRATVYSVTLLSQLNGLQSRHIGAAFTTASGLKLQTVTPQAVTAHSAVITWKAPPLPFRTYRLTYQLPGRDAKEVILSASVVQYELTGLLAGSNYTVKVEGEKEGHFIPVVSTEFSTGGLHLSHPADCSQLQQNGAIESGEMKIYPHGPTGKPVAVYCDMETDGGGWTVFQRRLDGKTDFYRNWKEYSKGFGHLSAEFWLGNELLHTLTSAAATSLRVDLRSGNETAFAHYANFTVAPQQSNYTMHVSGYSGNAGDSLRYHTNRPFSTRDKDPNPLSIHCAKEYMGGWWYKNCYKANLNGLYSTFSKNQGVVWIDWRGKDASIPFTEMKLRPASFASDKQG